MDDRFKFRGQTKDGKMIYGSLLCVNDSYYICEDDYDDYMDFQDTDLGKSFIPVTNPTQCTGDKDKNNKLIHDGDFIKDITDNKIYKVTFESGCFWFGISEFSYLSNQYIEVIGNIYENTELLESVEA